jgi:HlyD family secretion protein
MKVSKTRIVAGVAVVVVIAALAYAMRPKPLVVDLATVTRGALEATVDADGKTRVRERYAIVAPVTGRVERIVLVEGAAVRAGDVVARLRPPTLDSAAAAQVRARIDAADALVIQAAAQSRAAAADLTQRRRETSRAHRLAEAGAVADRVVEECELAQTQAEEAVHAADQRRHAAEADARQARATLIGQHDDAGSVVLVRAPADGRVLRVSERSERVVTAGTPLMEVGDPASLEIVVDVLSSDGALIHPGDRVRFADWAATGDAERGTGAGGRVREIEPAGYTKVSALGVEEQRVNVIVDPDAVPQSIGDGFRVEASIVVWSASEVTTVPRSALVQRTNGDRSIVWNTFVVRDGRVEVRNVRIGRVGGMGAQVLDGLHVGDLVVVFPSDQVKPGTRVTSRKT